MSLRRIIQLLHLALIIALALTACQAKPPATASTLTAWATLTLAPMSSPSATPVPTSACLAEGGQTRQIKIDSPVMREKLTFTIYLPACYDAEYPGGYPVLYLFHGQNMDDTYWPSLGITAAADRSLLEGHRPFIMVFPYEVHNWDPAYDSPFGDAVIKDLIPWVESTYSICAKRACQSIGGLSRGGGWAVHIALTNFEKFGSIGAHSFGYIPGDLYRVENLLTQYSAADFPRIYIDRGDQDYLRGDIDLYEQNLTYTKVAHEYVVNPGKHENAYWQSQVQNYLDWYMQGFDDLKP